jgi:FSR family fosmidomycin resistance protein-like MFS transporter
MNDALQSVISALYPVLRSDLSLSLGQIGLISLIYQLAASVFQPVFGVYFDKYPFPWTLAIATAFTLTGLVSISFAATLPAVLISVFLIGTGSSILHPEASRLTSLASGGRRGLAQSLFQVGGNIGGSLGPLMVAMWVAPFGRSHIVDFSIFAIIAFAISIPIGRWYSRHIKRISEIKAASSPENAKAVNIPRSTVIAIIILLLLIFSKYIYTASLGNFYTFFLIEKFGVEIKTSQILLFVFGISSVLGTMIGGPVGDKIGRKYVIWASIFGAAPFALMMPHANLPWTVVLTFCTGLVISSAFPAIIVYAQELLPYKLGLVSGLFYGFAFGVAGMASAILGKMADAYGIEAVYNACAYMPLLGFIAIFLPNGKIKGKQQE